MTKKVTTGLLIGLTGKAGAGKDTAALALIADGFHEYAFAEPMKEAAKILMGWGDDHVHDTVLKDTIDPLYGVSPRRVLQTLGTEWGRELIHKDIWLLRAKEHIRQVRRAYPTADIVITDVRFNNEARFIQENGGIVLEVVRPPTSGGGKEVEAHESEAGVFNGYIIHYLTNNGTVDQLHDMIRKVVELHTADRSLSNEPDRYGGGHD
jgi:hypothetical protein